MVRGSIKMQKLDRMAKHHNGTIDSGLLGQGDGRRPQLPQGGWRGGSQQSPRTVKRLTAVSNQLHKMAIVNNGHSSLKNFSRPGGVCAPRKGTIYQNWTARNEDAELKTKPDASANGEDVERDEEDEVWSTQGDAESDALPQLPLKGILHTHDDNQSPDETIQRPKKQVRISELRRGSLTGSLPDLTKASDADLEQSDALATAARGNPIPEGSEAFQTAMRDLDDDEDEDEDEDTTGKPKTQLSLHELRIKAANNNKLINRFRSKTAEVICINRLIMTYPKYMERLGSDCYPESAPQTLKHVHWGEVDVADVAELTRKSKSMPTTPRSDLSPSSVDAKCPMLNSSALRKPSNLRSSQELCIKSVSPNSPTDLSAQNSPRIVRKSPLHRVNSVGASTASPRLLRRKQTTEHKLLSRTRSNDA